MRLGLLLLVLGLAPPASIAQTVMLAPSEALQCLTPPEAERVALAYPVDAFERKDGGVVRIEMRFDHADQAPEVTVLNAPLSALMEAVRAHVHRFRVPCLGPGQRAVLAQDFLFDPTDGRKVMWTAARDRRDPTRVGGKLDCLKFGPAPAYPNAALYADEQGTVPVKATFVDAKGPPKVEVLDDTPHRSLVTAAVSAAQELRMPCHEGMPTSVAVDYSFLIDGGNRLVMPDMQLATFLRSVRDIRKAQVYFDFRSMKCPFDLRISMRQPARNNVVGEVGESASEREFFLDWLARQRLELTPKQQNRLMGQQFTVTVPCGVLSLGTASGGGASQ